MSRYDQFLISFIEKQSLKDSMCFFFVLRRQWWKRKKRKTWNSISSVKCLGLIWNSISLCWTKHRLANGYEVIEWDLYWGDQTVQIYGNYEAFPQLRNYLDW